MKLFKVYNNYYMFNIFKLVIIIVLLKMFIKLLNFKVEGGFCFYYYCINFYMDMKYVKKNIVGDFYNVVWIECIIWKDKIIFGEDYVLDIKFL